MLFVRRLRLIIFSCLVFTNPALAELPDNYQSLTSQQKQEILWRNIELSHQQNPLPELVKDDFWGILQKLKGLFNLSPTFDHSSDEMPEGRVKIIHANGSTAKFSLIALGGHPFSGIYNSGGIGIARLSVATTPTEDSFIPGMALKFLVANHSSLNLQVMNALEGQGENWNFFAKEFTNKIAHPTSWKLKAIEKIFEWTKNPANELDVDHLAQWDRNGNPVDNPISPEKLIFKPSEEVANLIEESSREDFRISLNEIPQGRLYELYGELQGIEYHIGTVMLEGGLLASDYGDKELFFQHNR